MPTHALPDLPGPVSEERIAALAAELAAARPPLELIREPGARERLSRDFFEYSPVLRPLLEGRVAQLVVRAATVEQVRVVAGACARRQVPLTVRGAGTGNYGQCVPLAGGVVLDLS
ncbi:MAG: FAD-binding protein, partial [Synechococcaceae cyanobacterium]|nr:FAD-binding protein [Synechococcaceae cyanobacterium]